MVFVLGLLLGCVAVMLLWLNSPGCSTFTGWLEGPGAADAGAVEIHNISAGTLLAADGTGRTIMATGDRGVRSIFTDSSGSERDVVCYTSIYCVDDTPCEEECEEDECVDNGKRCGFWPASTDTGNLAALTPMSDGKFYGECCPPYECVNGYCEEEEEECVQTSRMCGMVQNPNVLTHVEYIDYGDCCPPDECIDNVCSPPEECVETGEGCGEYTFVTGAGTYTEELGSCCPPDECVDNVCTPPEECNDYGELCGLVQDPNTITHVSYIDYGECCDPYLCVNNYCGGGQCAEAGQPCSADACCDGLTCSPNLICIEEDECTPLDGVCKTDSECCEGTYCNEYACSECKTSGSCFAGAGMCCEGYLCQNSRCTRDCQDEGDYCADDSECCSGYYCSANQECVSEEPECTESGGTCKSNSECCGGLVCEDYECVEEGECAAVGEYCGYYTTAGLDCCSDAYCYYGTCMQKLDYLCTDTEDGPDYYNVGTATGSYNGDYGSYTDYCADARTAVDYYCEVNNEYSPIYTGSVTCPNGCSGGACK